MRNSKIDITLILPSLAAGGAERVISILAKHIDRSKFNPTLLIIGFEKDNAYDISGVNAVYLNEDRVLSGLFKIFMYLFKTRPKVVMTCMSHVNIPVAFLLFLFPKTKLVAREANIKKVTAEYHQESRFIGKRLVGIAHKFTQKIVCQSQDMANELLEIYNIKKEKVVVINNPISEDFKVKTPLEKTDSKTHFITVGRLHPEKGHKRMLNVLAKLKVDFHYTIIGDGQEFENIKEQAKSLGIQDKITIIKYTKEVSKYLDQSDIFLQGSFAEGFPNALLESCAAGTPVVAFKAPGGTGEIINHGINGYLALDEKEYLEYINQLISNPLDFKSVSKSVFDKFNTKKIIDQYETVFKSVIK